MNFQGKIFFTQNWCNITLIYHISFDGVVAIYYSNLYIKRLNNIEIDKKKPPNFGPLGQNFRAGRLRSHGPPYLWASIGEHHTPVCPV
jgi:hypothetical protein